MKIKSTARNVVIGSLGLVVGVGITLAATSPKSQQQSQGTGNSQPQQVNQSQESQQQIERLTTKNFVFQNVKITRYTKEVSSNVDVAGELYQVTATITNQSKETLMPSGLSGVTYNLRDDQGRQYKEAAFGVGLFDDGLKSANGILPGQTRESVMIGVFDVTPGAKGLELGVSDGMFSGMKYVKPSQAQANQVPATSATSAAIAVSSPVAQSPQFISAAQPSPATQPNFDSLSPCDQLDSIARGGKSVSDFLVASARVNALPKYEAAIAATCPWNAEQLAVANRILHPPAVKVQTVVRRQTAPAYTQRQATVVADEPDPSSTKSAPSWNNCNGIQEAGESYSASCAAAQRFNDRTWGWRDNRDKRTENIGGIDNRGGGVTKPYDQGYSIK